MPHLDNLCWLGPAGSLAARVLPELARGLRGFGLRAAALLVDLALITGLEMLLYMLLALFWLAAFAPAGALPIDAVQWVDIYAGDALDAVFTILAGTYFIGCAAKWGQTAGKRLLGLKVVRQAGGPAGFGQVFLRERWGGSRPPCWWGWATRGHCGTAGDKAGTTSWRGRSLCGRGERPALRFRRFAGREGARARCLGS